MVRAEREKQNDRKRNADQPEQDGAHRDSLLDLSRAENGSLAEQVPNRASDVICQVKYSPPS